MLKTNQRGRKIQKTQGREISLSAALYENVKEKIINGEVRPGSIILERPLAEEFGVSRTPVREALKRLSQEGWIDWKERRRAVVSKITVPKILELLKIREMIEPFAVAKAIDGGAAQLLAGHLAAINMKMSAARDAPVESMKYDMEFHTALVNSLNVSSLNVLWQKVREDMTRLAMYSVYPQRDPEIIAGEHKTLMDALWHAERDAALRCIKEHLSVMVDYFRQRREELL